jgi:DNA-binding transcriptional ArsR family regulator
MSLLPTRDPAVPDADPRVLAVDSEDADDVLSALSASTARELLAALHREPAPPGELADRVTTSLQNAQYHLEKLESAGAVEVVDTAYSEKGREMDVYAPANQPLVICAADEGETSGLRNALSNFVGGLTVLAGASVVVQELIGGGVGSVFGPEVQSGSAGGYTPNPNYFPNGSSGGHEAVTEAAGVVADGAGQTAGAGSIPPGLVFFGGGALVLLALVAFAMYR